MRCIAIDDEPLGLDLLQDSIGKIPFLGLAGTFTNPLEALALLQREPIDLVFVDIQMPGLTGLQFIESLAHPPLVILVTAYEQYALQGFQLNVVDYLLKPVAFDRFLKACTRAQELHQLRHGAARKEGGHFFVSADYSQLKVVYADIVYIEGLKDYIRIHLRGAGKPVVSRMSLKALEEQLPPSFLRVHKSYIVSNDCITAVKRSSISLGSVEIPVGESYRDVLERITAGA